MKLKLLVVMGTLFSCIAGGGQLETISPEAALKLQQDNKAVIIDVREADEIASGKVKSALSLPLSEMEKNRSSFDKKVSTLKKDQLMIVYCRSGRRSEIVGSELLKKGFKVNNLGGFENWKNKKLPVE